MIRIIIEMWPGGDESKKRVLAVGNIWNDATGSRARGNYQGMFSKVSHKVFKAGGGIFRKGRVQGFPRTRLGVWDLLYRMLREAVGDRNP